MNNKQWKTCISCLANFKGLVMTREEIILQSAQSKIMFNREIMRQITNLANNRAIKDNLFFTKRDELLKLEIQLTQEEEEILK